MSHSCLLLYLFTVRQPQQEQEEDQVQRTLTGKERERLRKITMVERWSFWGVSVYFLAKTKEKRVKFNTSENKKRKQRSKNQIFS